jgi:hypothetical protein
LRVISYRAAVSGVLVGVRRIVYARIAGKIDDAACKYYYAGIDYASKFAAIARKIHGGACKIYCRERRNVDYSAGNIAAERHAAAGKFYCSAVIVYRSAAAFGSKEVYIRFVSRKKHSAAGKIY